MNTKLFIGNLSPATTGEDLRLLFSQVSGVVSVVIAKDKVTGKPKGFAYMEMVSQGDAGKAVSEYNGYPLDGRKIKVSPAKVVEFEHHPQMRKYVEYKSYNESVANAGNFTEMRRYAYGNNTHKTNRS